MASNRLIFPIIIFLFVLLHRGHAQCSCSKNNILKNLQGSSLQFTKQNLPKFEKFNDFFKNPQKKVPEAHSICTSKTLQQPSLDRQNHNIVQQPLELQIPISSISIGKGNGIFFEDPSTKKRLGSNCCQSPGRDLVGELNLLNRPSLKSHSAQNTQKMESGFVPISITNPPNVFDMSNQPRAYGFDLNPNLFDMSNQPRAFGFDLSPNLAPASASPNLFPQNNIQNLPSNLEKAVLAQSPIFNTATQKAQNFPVVYLIQAPSTPQYVPTVSYPASSSKSMDLKTVIPLLLDLLNEKRCGCGCPNCLNCGCRLKKEYPIIHGGYAKKNVNGQIFNESEPSETAESADDKNEDIKEEPDNNTMEDEGIDSGEYYDTDAPDLKDDSKEK